MITYLIKILSDKLLQCHVPEPFPQYRTGSGTSCIEFFVPTPLVLPYSLSSNYSLTSSASPCPRKPSPDWFSSLPHALCIVSTVFLGSSDTYSNQCNHTNRNTGPITTSQNWVGEIKWASSKQLHTVYSPAIGHNSYSLHNNYSQGLQFEGHNKQFKGSIYKLDTFEKS